MFAQGIRYRISYDIRLHKVLQLVWWVAVPVNIMLFFHHALVYTSFTFATLPFIVQLSIYAGISILFMALMYRFFTADMKQTDAILLEAFDGKTGPVQIMR